jgi:hypothetical protein
MKTSFPSPLLTALTLTLALSLGGGCLGQQARKRVLAPAITLGATEALRHADASPSVDRDLTAQFKIAVDVGDYDAALQLWPAVYAWAQDGIDCRTDIVAGAKVSLKEPLRQTDIALRKAAAR